MEIEELRNWDWIAKRIKRYVPEPANLLERVKMVFVLYSLNKDAKTGEPLFNSRAFAEAIKLLKHIALGCFSDPPGKRIQAKLIVDFPYAIGINLYFKQKLVDGLMTYRCSRGTNSCEGSVHQKIIDKFGSYNAGPEFADCLLAEYRNRHNERASVRNRPNYPDVGHYDPWLIDELKEALTSATGAEQLNNWVESNSFAPTTESYGIVALSSYEDESVKRFDPELNLKPSHRFLAKKMQSKYPFLPVSTEEERRLFRQLTLKYRQTKNYDALTSDWNSQANGSTIMYKLPSHLSTYEAIFLKNANLRDSIAESKENLNAFKMLLKVPKDIDEASSGSAVVQPRTRPQLGFQPGTATLVPLAPPVRFDQMANGERDPNSVPLVVQVRSGRTCKCCFALGLHEQSRACKGRGNRSLCPNFGAFQELGSS